jgi:hypothetical protein
MSRLIANTISAIMAVMMFGTSRSLGGAQIPQHAEMPSRDNESRFGGRLTILRISGLVFVAAFAVRLALILAFPSFGALPPTEMERVASSWAATGELANPYATPTGPTAHLAPVYPVIIGTIYRVCGAASEGHFVQAVFGCFMSALRCALLVPLAAALRLGYRTALIAGLIGIFYISAIGTELRGTWEAPLIALLLVALSFVAIRFSQRPVYSGASVILLGLFAGISILIAPSMLPTIGALLCVAVAMDRGSLWRSAAWAAAIAVVAGLVITPWLIRNKRVFGVATLRTNFGLELSLAYNAAQRASSLDPEMEKTHPTHNPIVSQEVARLGEVEFNRERRKEALNWIQSHPWLAARLVGIHVLYFWFPPAESRVFRLMMAGVTVCAWLGFLQLRRRSREAFWIIGLIWLTYPLLYYITFWSSRYRYPMDWTLVLCVAVFLDWICRLAVRPRPVIGNKGLSK